MLKNERKQLRIALCERLIMYSDDIHCIAVNRDLARDLREAEALITILADDIERRAKRMLEDEVSDDHNI